MIGLEPRLEKWQAAGLIGEETAHAIRAYETAHARPIAQWAIAGLALLALGLGLALVVSANWDRIPGHAKLALHFAATASAAFAVWDGSRRGRFRQSEAALFLLAAMILGGIVLQGQVYQTTTPTWVALALWVALSGPVLLLRGASRLTGIAFGLMVGALALALLEDGMPIRPMVHPFEVGMALALPFLLLSVAARGRTGDIFALALREIALAYLLGFASIAHVGWASRLGTDQAFKSLQAAPYPLIAGCVVLLMLRRRPAQRRVLATVVIATFAATAIVSLLPHGNEWYWRLFGTLIFAAMWGAICWAAHANGWRLLFGAGIAAIAIRLFIIYFELFGSLATTGLGLIAGGILVLALLALGRRIMAMVPRRERNPR